MFSALSTLQIFIRISPLNEDFVNYDTCLALSSVSVFLICTNMVLNTTPAQSVIHPPHYLHELPQEDEERLGKIFNNLDLDGNGKIDIHDLSVALKEFGVSHRDAQVKELFVIEITRRTLHY